MPPSVASHRGFYPSESQTVALAGGARALVRTLSAGESGVIQEVFEGMSERSRYQRFVGAKQTLSRRELEFLSAVDHENHEALIAIEPLNCRAIGEARLVRDEQDRSIAEVAFAVADAWQGRRLGANLADLLARRARELGITRVHGYMLADNSRAHALMRRMGRAIAQAYGSGALELEVALD